MRSRYSETDQMGYVYNGHYLDYFEVARTEMIRSIGISYRTLEEQGIMFPVIESHIRYKKPLLYDDLMHIQVMIFDKPVTKLKTYYKIRTARTDEVHAIGRVILCFIDKEKRKPRRAPELFITQLNKATQNE